MILYNIDAIKEGYDITKTECETHLFSSSSFSDVPEYLYLHWKRIVATRDTIKIINHEIP